MEIHLLGENDAAAFQGLRLQSLKDHPEAFGADYEEEVEMPIADVGKRLVGGLPENATFGAFHDDTLSRSQNPAPRHHFGDVCPA